MLWGHSGTILACGYVSRRFSASITFVFVRLQLLRSCWDGTLGTHNYDGRLLPWGARRKRFGLQASDLFPLSKERLFTEKQETLEQTFSAYEMKYNSGEHGTYPV